MKRGDTNMMFQEIPWRYESDICICEAATRRPKNYIIRLKTFQHHMLSFMFSVRFVDIGGIVDHFCLNFLFIIEMKKYMASNCTSIRIPKENCDTNV